jgi:hypothetical protein
MTADADMTLSSLKKHLSSAKTALVVDLQGHQVVSLGMHLVPLGMHLLQVPVGVAVIIGILVEVEVADHPLPFARGLGYLLMAGDAAAALFQVIARRSLKGSVVLTTNRAVGSRGEILDDTVVAAAMLDRLCCKATVVSISGDSYRLRAHQTRAQALRERYGQGERA